MNVKNYLKEKIINSAKTIGLYQIEHDELELSEPKQKGHGDLSTNVALILASREKKNPREIALSIVKGLNIDRDLIEKVEIAGPGFINFTLSQKLLHRLCIEILDRGDDFGKSDIGKGKKTQVEFVSANPTGPLTIGHGRQAVLGDTIARLLDATGHRVTREYYFNNAGRQMRILADSVKLRYMELFGKSIDFPEDYYQGEYINEIAKIAANEKGRALIDTDELEYFQHLAEETIFNDIKTTLARLNIFFDVYYNEKSLYETGKIDEVIKKLREKDLAYDKDGAVWFRTTRFGMDKDRVIVKSTGEPTYRLPDIAYHKDKIDRGFELIVDIFGADHIDTYPDVLAGIEALGYDKNRVKVLIHQFVTLVEGNEKVKMSTRRANFITLDELIDEVGTDVTRYFFINRSMTSHLNFDLKLAKTQTDENPVFYVQYAHARICSIIRHAEKEGIDPDEMGDLSLLTTPEEIDLMRILIGYPDVVARAAKNFEPHKIPAYLETVATLYHRFQHAGKVDDKLRVVTKDKPMTLARLALCRAARIVLSNGLTLLGITQPEKM